MPKDILNIVFAPKKLSQITDSNEILTWDQARKQMHLYHSKPFLIGNPKLILAPTKYPYAKADAKNEVLRNLICLWWGDITKCKIESIVNSADKKLTFGICGGGVLGAVHRNAGKDLAKQCDERYPNGCKVTECVITDGFQLPATFIIHAVGPKKMDLNQLSKTYKNVINKCIEQKIKQVCFCTIGSEIEKLSIEKASQVAVYSVIKCLNEPYTLNDKSVSNQYEMKEDVNENDVEKQKKTELKSTLRHEYFDKIIFNCWNEKEVMAYKRWLIEQLG